jgi:hypothetical protein
MPDTQLTTPTGEQGENWGTAQVIEEFQYDPSVTATTVLTNGMVVIISSGYTPGTGVVTSLGAAAYPVIRKATTTPSFLNVGVVVNAPTSGYVPGSIVQVCTKGVTQVLCDANNTTYGNLLVAGSTTAGAATASASVTAGKTIALCLQTATISTGTALVYGYVGGIPG